MNLLHSTACVLLFGVACLGCRARAPAPAPAPGPAAVATPAPEFAGLGPTEVKEAFKGILPRAIAPRVKAIDKVDESSYRYRAAGFLGRTDTITTYLMQIARVDVTKGTWVFVFDESGRRIEKVKFKTVEDAHHYKALIDYVASDEYSKLAEEDKKARLAAQAAPPPPAKPSKPSDPSETGDPCAICGEPRGDMTPCPHCGME